MFWIWYEWQVFAKPYNLEEDDDTIKLNPLAKYFWRNMPEKYQGMAITIEVIMEGN